jgi:DNA-binding NarL/FixJ family response regulator
MPHKKVGELTFEMMQKWRITEREYSVVTLIKKGNTNKEIAQSLSISANTVNNHIANIYSKTQVRSRIDLLNLLNEEQ